MVLEIKRMKKRLLTIALCTAAGCFALGLTGCSGGDSDNAETAATESTLSGEETDALFNIGEIQDNTYINDFFNIKYTGNDNWRLLNEEQLATISSSIKDVLTNDSAKDALESGKTSIIMYAVSGDADRNASLMVEKHGINNTQDADMDAFLSKSITSLTESLPAQGFKELEVSEKDITFCSEPAKGIQIKAKYDVKANDGTDATVERDIYETMVYVFRGSYSGCITASSFDEDKTGEVLDMFSKLQ